MNISTRSNIFEVTAASTLEAYASHVEGTASCTALVVSERALGDAARSALAKSLSSLGFVGAGAVGAVGTAGSGVTSAASTGAAGTKTAGTKTAAGSGLAFAVLSAEGNRLGAADAFAIVEGLDPLRLVIADAASAELLSLAYRCPIELDSQLRLLGRPSVAFANFEDMLGESEEKQRAWAILKRLSR